MRPYFVLVARMISTRWALGVACAAPGAASAIAAASGAGAKGRRLSMRTERRRAGGRLRNARRPHPILILSGATPNAAYHGRAPVAQWQSGGLLSRQMG